MARCSECTQVESRCACAAPPASMPNASGLIHTLPNGTRYFDRDVAAGLALGVFVALALIGMALSRLLP